MRGSCSYNDNGQRGPELRPSRKGEEGPRGRESELRGHCHDQVGGLVLKERGESPASRFTHLDGS